MYEGTFSWQVGKLFVVVERTRIFVWREGNVAITRVFVDKKCRFRGKGKQRGSMLILVEVKLVLGKRLIVVGLVR